MKSCLASALASLYTVGADGAASTRTDAITSNYYKNFEVPRLENTTFAEVSRLLLQGLPFVVLDGAKGLPMASWDCDYVKEAFPESRIRQEGGGEENGVKMGSNWTNLVKPFRGSSRFPEGAPKNRPFYWDIAKAYHEKERKWGKNPKAVVKKIVETTSVPYWLPQQSAKSMGQSSEMWFHPPGAGAPAHMDPHCSTTVSYCFSGKRKWRMMMPPLEPHPDGYFDGQVYGASDPQRQGEWQPIWEVEAPAGSAVVVYPGMVHETLSIGEGCSSSISQTFKLPIAAAYYRTFWPRFALIREDTGMCGHVVESMVNLGTGTRVPPAATADDARQKATTFVKRVDTNGDGFLSESELSASNRAKGDEKERTLDELVSFHDTNGDGQVSVGEVEESWIMFATTQHKVRSQAHGRERDEF